MSSQTATDAATEQPSNGNGNGCSRLREGMPIATDEDRADFSEHIHAQRWRELTEESAIDPDVIRERGYQTFNRLSKGDNANRKRLKALKIPTWSHKEDWMFPGLVIPMHTPAGGRISAQWKPWTPITHNGDKRKYACPVGEGNRIDVHPRNRYKIVDIHEEMWLTEGIKKADSLTSQGICAAAMNGVFGWKASLGTVGDWENILLKGREVTICFDSDTRTKRQVLDAMIRLGRWLKQVKKAKRVHYLIVPNEHNGKPTKGVDDYFAAGGTLAELKDVRTTTAPTPANVDARFTEAVMAQHVADELLADHFIWVDGEGWLTWNGMVWGHCSHKVVEEEIRRYFVTQHLIASEDLVNGDGNREEVEGWFRFLTESKIGHVRSVAEAIVMVKADQLDTDKDLVNTASGVVDVTNGGAICPHDMPASPTCKPTWIRSRHGNRNC